MVTPLDMASPVNFELDQWSTDPTVEATDFFDNMQACNEIFPCYDLRTTSLPDNSGLFARASGEFHQPASYDQTTDEPQTRQRTRSKDVNRRNQRKYREKKKTELQSLQAELASMREALQHMQSERQRWTDQYTQNPLQMQMCTNHTSVPHLPWQGPAVIDHRILDRIMPIWISGIIVTGTLTIEQTNDIQQLACLGPQQLSILWEGQRKDMAACLRHAGQDMDHSTRDHLQQLLNEYCCTNFVKARGDPTGHKALLSSHSFTPDPLAVAHVMQFSRSQQNALFFLRRSHLRQLADISKRRQQLLRQLQSAPEALGVSSGDLASSHFTVDDITQQLQKLLTDEHVAYMEYLRTVGHEVSTLWQAAVAVVHSFPDSTDLIATVDALAEEEGEPPAEAFRAATNAYGAIDAQGAGTIVRTVETSGQCAHTADTYPASQGPDSQVSTSLTIARRQMTAAVNLNRKAIVSDVASKALEVVASLVTDDLTPESIFSPSSAIGSGAHQ